LSLIEARIIGTALRKSYVRKVTDVWKVTDVCAAITNEFFAVSNLLIVAAQENEICAMFATRRTQSPAKV
jgi:hypothetical protein